MNSCHRIWLIVISILLPIIVNSNSFAEESSREIAIIIDTSGSMSGNDNPRYTVQISKILSELIGPADNLTVIELSNQSGCNISADMSLTMSTGGGKVDRFKQQVDRRIKYHLALDNFTAAVRTGIKILSSTSRKQRMLLILADSGGFDCREDSPVELQKLHDDSGAMIAAINLGNSAGAFSSYSAFDFTTGVLNSEQLIQAVAQVYQKFLGGKKVQTGRVKQGIEFTLPDFVSEAFLVVAADGLINSINPSNGNPAAKLVDLKHGSGQTTGLDNQIRAYQIIRLERPLAGTWRFDVPGLSTSAGWMLIQETAIGVRFITPPILAKGVITPIEIELYDKKTGKRLTDTPPGIKLNLKIDGHDVEFTDDGLKHDKKSNDGVLTGELKLDNPGKQTVNVHVETDFIDQTVTLEAEVVEASWKLRVDSPEKTEVDTPTLLKVALESVGDTSQLSRPKQITVNIGYGEVILQDDGSSGDAQANDLVYTGTWHPELLGVQNLSYAAVPSAATQAVSKEIEVLGHLEFGAAVPIDFGETGGNNPGLPGTFDLSNATVKGSYEISVSSTFDKWGSALEILDDSDSKWKKLSATPLTLKLEQHGNRTWQVRISTGKCPAANSADVQFEIIAKATNPAGEILQLATPIKVIIHPTHWFTCWWPVIAGAIGVLIGAFIIYGIISPSRFSRRLGVVISQEEDISEGFFHPIRATRGSGSGFYRDARVYICADYRLSGSAKGGFVRLRAEGKRVKLQAVGGAGVWRKTMEDEWEQLPQGEISARNGVLYKDDLGTLFFDIRNG